MDNLLVAAVGEAMKPKRSIFFLVGVYGVLVPFVIGLLIHFVFRSSPPKEYNTLSEIETYVGRLKEYVESDDGHFEDPHFLSFYRTRLPSLFSMALREFGLWQRPAFSPKYLCALLVNQTKEHHKKGLVNGKDSFIHIKANEKTKVYVFGDIHAALHSLVRDLRELAKRGVLSEELVVKDKDSFIIFNGDLIDRASYSIDTLIVVALLMQKNPDNVIYVAGEHERDAHWKDYSLKRELTSRARIYSEQSIPFYGELTSFFATLPEAVYVSGQSDTQEAMRISFFNANELSFKEKQLSRNFLTQPEPVKIYEARKLHTLDSHVDVRVAITTQDWHYDNRIKNGIGILDQMHGETSWALLSSPTLVHKTFLDFHEDAFAQVTMHPSVTNASITNIHRHGGSANKFEADASKNAVTGRPFGDDATLTSIKVGSSLSLERGIPVVGQQLKAGMNARVLEFNRNSTYRGAVVRLFFDNDDYVPRFSAQNIQEQLHHGVRYFLSPMGTANVMAAADIVQRERGVVMFPQTGSSQLRSAKYSRMVHTLPTYEQEARTLVRAIKQTHGATKFALFYQDDSFGKGPHAAAVEELKRLGITQIISLPYTRGSLSFQAAADEIRRNQPDAIGMFAVAQAAKEFIRQIGIGELLSTNLFGLSLIGEIPFRLYLKDKGLSVVLASSVPNPHVSMTPIAQSFRKAMTQQDNIIDVFSFEAYVAASLFLHALNLQQHPTPDSVLRVFETMKHQEFEGLKFNFNPQTRSLATQIFVETDDRDEWEAFAL